MHRAWVPTLFIVVCVALVLHALHLGVVAEDAYIGFRFARNWSSGTGLVWNVGEAPVEGYTNFLWVALMAAAMLAELDVALFSQVLGVLAGVATLFYVYRFCRRLLGLAAGLALLPCAFLASSGPFATWATSGMETSLFTLLVTATAYHMVAYWKSRSVAQIAVASWLALLASLTRPEGIGVFGTLAIVHCAYALRAAGVKDIVRFAVAAGICFGLPFAVYFLWRFNYYGYLLPNTFYAKTGGTYLQWGRGGFYAGYFAFHFVVPVIPLLGVNAWRRVRADPARVEPLHVVSRYGSGSCAAILFTYTAYIVYVGGDYMAMYRFFVPILPLGYILLAYLARSLALGDPSGSPRKSMMVSLTVVTFCLASTFVHSTRLEWNLFAKPPITHGQHRGVITERWHVQRLTAIGHFFRDYAESPNSGIVLAGLGAVSYFSELPTWDYHGLVVPYIAHMEQEGLGRGFPGHEKMDFVYLLEEKKPTYVMVSRQLSPQPCNDYPRSVAPGVRALMRRDYQLEAEWISDEANRESGYFCFLKRRPGR